MSVGGAIMRNVLLGAVVAFAVLTTPVPASAQKQGDPCAPRPFSIPEYVAWSGPWAKHGASLEIDPRGCGVLNWRIYEWCPPGPRFHPCDWMEGNLIRYGGAATFRLDARAGAATSGQVVLSTDPELCARPGIVLALNDDGTLLIEMLGQPFAVFCRPWAWITEVCGA